MQLLETFRNKAEEMEDDGTVNSMSDNEKYAHFGMIKGIKYCINGIKKMKL